MIRRFLTPLIVVIVLGLLGLALVQPKGGTDPIIGQTAPAFKLRNIDGGQIALAQFKGKPVVVNFFASWCAPCKDEAPLLKQAALDFAAQGIVIVGIAYNDKPVDTRKFRDEFGLGFPILTDNPQSGVSVAYGLVGVPETYFINAVGQIVQRHKGALSEADLRAGFKAITQ